MSLTLVVEDGTGLLDSNSYISVEDADDYWELRNDSTWANLTDDAKLAAIIKAAQYLDYTYRWVGDRYSTTQAMSWPRVVFFDRDARAMYAHVIPQRIKDAQCELAREAATSELLPAQERGGRVQSESVGALSVSYFSDAPAEKSFPLVDRILTDLVTPESAGALTIGALLS